MLDLITLGRQIARRREELGLTQSALAKDARIGRTTVDGLENGRFGELGVVKIMRVLSTLGLELKIVPAAGKATHPRRPSEGR